jgi:hypothetical protein
MLQQLVRVLLRRVTVVDKTKVVYRGYTLEEVFTDIERRFPAYKSVMVEHFKNYMVAKVLP